MTFKRSVAGLRGQDWLAITIELAIVILGVFIVHSWLMICVGTPLRLLRSLPDIDTFEKMLALKVKSHLPE